MIPPRRRPPTASRFAHASEEPGRERAFASVGSAFTRGPRRRYHRRVKIDTEEVRRIANLAHLEFEEKELPRLAAQLSSILTYMESLERVDTSEIDPTFHSVDHEGVFREDRPAPGLDVHEATQGAPGGRPGAFIVPKVLG